MEWHVLSIHFNSFQSLQAFATAKHLRSSPKPDYFKGVAFTYIYIYIYVYIYIHTDMCVCVHVLRYVAFVVRSVT